MNKIVLLLLLLPIVGCKINYDQKITCPTFSAEGIAAYHIVDIYWIAYPDKTSKQVQDTSCVVENMK